MARSSWQHLVSGYDNDDSEANGKWNPKKAHVQSVFVQCKMFLFNATYNYNYYDNCINMYKYYSYYILEAYHDVTTNVYTHL